MELPWKPASSLHRALLESEVQDGGLGPNSADRRFRDPGWKHPPFSLLAQAQLAAEAQWHAATTMCPAWSAITQGASISSAASC